MVGVVNWSSLQTYYAGKSLHIVDGSDSGEFGAEAVSSDRRHRDVVVVHEADNVLSHFVEIETGVMV